jgi:hypothetical protein
MKKSARGWAGTQNDHVQTEDTSEHRETVSSTLRGNTESTHTYTNIGGTCQLAKDVVPQRHTYPAIMPSLTIIMSLFFSALSNIDLHSIASPLSVRATANW